MNRTYWKIRSRLSPSEFSQLIILLISFVLVFVSCSSSTYSPLEETRYCRPITTFPYEISGFAFDSKYNMLTVIHTEGYSNDVSIVHLLVHQYRFHCNNLTLVHANTTSFHYSFSTECSSGSFFGVTSWDEVRRVFVGVGDEIIEIYRDRMEIVGVYSICPVVSEIGEISHFEFVSDNNVQSFDQKNSSGVFLLGNSASIARVERNEEDFEVSIIDIFRMVDTPPTFIDYSAGKIFVLSGDVSAKKREISVFEFFGFGDDNNVLMEFENIWEIDSISSFRCYNHHYQFQHWKEFQCFVVLNDGNNESTLQYRRFSSTNGLACSQTQMNGIGNLRTVIISCSILVLVSMFLTILLHLGFILIKSRCNKIANKIREKNENLKYVSEDNTELILVFTDLVDSTTLWSTERAAMEKAIIIHDEIIKNRLSLYSGTLVKQNGDGFLVVFDIQRLEKAVQFSLDVQRSMNNIEVDWPQNLLKHESCKPEVVQNNENRRKNSVITVGLKIRIGIHFGNNFMVIRDKDNKIIDFIGCDVNYCSRVETYGVGGRILISSEFYKKLCETEFFNIYESVEVQEIPDVMLKGLREKQTLYCIGEDGRMFKKYQHFDRRKKSVVGALTRFFNSDSHQIIEAVKTIDPTKIKTVLPVRYRSFSAGQSQLYKSDIAVKKNEIQKKRHTLGHIGKFKNLTRKSSVTPDVKYHQRVARTARRKKSGSGDIFLQLNGFSFPGNSKDT